MSAGCGLCIEGWRSFERNGEGQLRSYVKPCTCAEGGKRLRGLLSAKIARGLASDLKIDRDTLDRASYEQLTAAELALHQGSRAKAMAALRPGRKAKIEIDDEEVPF